jgi:hypothetical protein
MVRVESRGNPYAVSPKGAIGLAQIMPSTAAEYGVPKEALYHPAVQWMLFDRIMSKYLDRYGGDPVKAVAAWNAGQGAVDTGRYPLETQDYLRKVSAAGADLAMGGIRGRRFIDQQRQLPPFLGPSEEPAEEPKPELVATKVAPRVTGPAGDTGENFLARYQAQRQQMLAQNARRVSELLGA